MRVVTLLVLIVIIAGGLWYANNAGWFGKAEEQADSFDAYYAKGMKQYQDMEYDAAIASFREALAKAGPDDDSADCIRRMAESYAGKKMYAEALDEYKKFLTEYPNHPNAPAVKNAMEKVEGLR